MTTVVGDVVVLEIDTVICATDISNFIIITIVIVIVIVEIAITIVIVIALVDLLLFCSLL